MVARVSGPSAAMSATRKRCATSSSSRPMRSSYRSATAPRHAAQRLRHGHFAISQRRHAAPRLRAATTQIRRSVQVGPTIYGAGYSKIPHVDGRAEVRAHRSRRATLEQRLALQRRVRRELRRSREGQGPARREPGHDRRRLLPDRRRRSAVADESELCRRGASAGLGCARACCAAYYQPIVYGTPTTPGFDYLIGKNWTVEEKITHGVPEGQSRSRAVVKRHAQGQRRRAVGATPTRARERVHTRRRGSNRSLPFERRQEVHRRAAGDQSRLHAASSNRRCASAWRASLRGHAWISSRPRANSATTAAPGNRAVRAATRDSIHGAPMPSTSRTRNTSAPQRLSLARGLLQGSEDATSSTRRDRRLRLLRRSSRRCHRAYFAPGRHPADHRLVLAAREWQGGNLKGVEFAVSLTGELFTDALTGFGTDPQHLAHTRAASRSQDPPGNNFVAGNNLGNIPLPGLSEDGVERHAVLRERRLLGARRHAGTLRIHRRSHQLR